MNNQLSIEKFYKTHSVDQDFDPVVYLMIYPDAKDFYKSYCQIKGISDKERLYYHYYYYSRHEMSKLQLSDIQKFYLSNNIDIYFDEKFYLDLYPDSKNFYKEYCDQHHINDKYRLYYHYHKYTKDDISEIAKFYLNTYNIIDTDFDEKKYLDYYPEAEGYCQPWAKDHNISDRQRLFHHYVVFGYKKQKKSIDQLDIKIKDSIISIQSNEIKWQFPACTEKFYFYNHAFIDSKIKEYYVSFPWATFIDKHMFLNDKHIEKIKNIISMKDGKKHTVCQHIRWKQLIDLWEKIGITDIYLSHYETNINNTDNISFHPWPLMAANYENKCRSGDLSIKENRNKKYLASFIGAYKSSYRGTTRLDLRDILSKEKQLVYELKDEWFYEKIVFDHQVNKKKLSKEYLDIYEKETQRYNSILSDSIFSLCPEGTGPNTIRLWESMAIGVIPVIFSDDWIPPKITGLDWNDFSVFIKNEDLKNTVAILRSFSEEKLETMKLNCINAYKYFRQMDCFTN